MCVRGIYSRVGHIRGLGTKVPVGFRDGAQSLQQVVKNA